MNFGLDDGLQHVNRAISRHQSDLLPLFPYQGFPLVSGIPVEFIIVFRKLINGEFHMQAGCRRYYYSAKIKTNTQNPLIYELF